MRSEIDALFDSLPATHKPYWEQLWPQFVAVWQSLPSGVPNEVMNISISGRVAIGLTCIENVARSLGTSSRFLSQVLDKMWEFVETNRLDSWDSEMEEIVGKDHRALRNDTEPENPDWQALPPLLRKLIHLTYHGIGAGNLFGGIIGCSMVTLWPTLQVLDLSARAGVPLFDLKPFKRSPFSQFHGWGDRVPRAFFKSEDIQ